MLPKRCKECGERNVLEAEEKMQPPPTDHLQRSDCPNLKGSLKHQMPLEEPFVYKHKPHVHPYPKPLDAYPLKIASSIAQLEQVSEQQPSIKLDIKMEEKGLLKVNRHLSLKLKSPGIIVNFDRKWMPCLLERLKAAIEELEGDKVLADRSFIGAYSEMTLL